VTEPGQLVPGVLLTVAIGAVGGTVFFFLGLPLAWMLGAMCATTVAALGGAPLQFWLPLRTIMITVIGTLLGSAFTPEVVERAGHWLGGVGVTVAYVAVISAVVLVYLVRTGRFDRITCFFAATPGGLGIMTLVGESHGGDPRAISLTHATRILIVVFSIPLYLTFVEGLEIGPTTQLVGKVEVAGPVDLAILAVCGVVGSLVAHKLRIPNAGFMGPFALSAAVYFTGFVEGRPPIPLVWIAQLVIGSALGCRFVGVGLGDVRRIVVVALGSATLMLVSAILVSRLAAPLLGLDTTALVLALAPGGLPEMTLMALALDIDTAFVSTMHIVRIILVVAAAPFLFRLLGWRPSP
jgi:hypothetical protein